MQAQPEFSKAVTALLIGESYRLDQSLQLLIKPYAQIIKPIKPSKIYQEVQSLLKERAKLTAKVEMPVELINYEGKGRVLLVEDEPLSQKYCQILLQGRGYHLDVAATGQSALDLVAKQRYESILMDVGLPDASGIDITRAIRSSDNLNRDVPIIALTAHIDGANQQACLEAGMTAFLNKPFSPDKLCEILRQVAILLR